MTAALKAYPFFGNYSPIYRDEKYHSKRSCYLTKQRDVLNLRASLFQFICFVFQRDYNGVKQDGGRRMDIYAHRGSSGTHPENTIAAFQEAARLPIQGVEFDVHLSKDDEIVVIHDEKIDRTANGI